MKIDRNEWNEIASEMLNLYAWDNWWSELFGDAFPGFEWTISRYCIMLVEHIFQQAYFEDVPLEAFEDDIEETRMLCYDLMCDYSESLKPSTDSLTHPIDVYPEARQICEKLYNELYNCVQELQKEHYEFESGYKEKE